MQMLQSEMIIDTRRNSSRRNSSRRNSKQTHEQKNFTSFNKTDQQSIHQPNQMMIDIDKIQDSD